MTLNLKGVSCRRLFFAWSILCGLLIFLLFSHSALALSAELGCSASKIQEWSTVSHVHDGDTIKLNDGRTIRLIGIDAPERARRNQPAEPFSSQATKWLRTLLEKNSKVGLRYGAERFDQYGRTLAHLYLTDMSNVEEKLLREGLATTFVFPPNVANIECLINAENEAQKLRKGIWGLAKNRLKYSGNIKRGNIGFFRIYGKVLSVKTIKAGSLLLLDGPLQLYIPKMHMKYFDKGSLHALLGSKIEVQGRLYRYKKQLQMKIVHPLVIKSVL